jgi:hypothetical protein
MRLVIAIVIASAAAACFQPRFQDGLRCGPESGPQCPSGQTCVDGFCRHDGVATADAAPDATTGDATDDNDGDGVANGNDNCPAIANPTQHDEDEDTFGDPCDLCPHFDFEFDDRDGDGVGDDCDPSDQQDSIIYFAGFDVADPTWSFTGGSWQVMNDSLHQSSTITTASEARPGAFDAADYDVLRIDIGGDITAIGTGFRSVYTRNGEQGDATQPYHLCAIDNESAATMSSKVLEYFDGANYIAIAPEVSGTPLTTDSQFHIGLVGYFNDDYLACGVALDPDPFEFLDGTATNLLHGGTSIHTKSVAARFHYFIAIGH